jgi:hypothetical protein
MKVVVDHHLHFMLPTSLKVSWRMCMVETLAGPTISLAPISVTLDKLITQKISHSHGQFLCVCLNAGDIQMTYFMHLGFLLTRSPLD